MPLNVAVIGAGRIGNNHAGIYHSHPDCHLVAVCDVFEDKARETAAKFDCRSFASVKDMLDAGLDIDIASVCTAGTENGGDHHAPTIELLNAGVAVLGEKPISNELPKAEEMVALAREKKHPLRHQLKPPLYARRRDGERLGERGAIGRTQYDRHDHVDKQPR